MAASSDSDPISSFWRFWTQTKDRIAHATYYEHTASTGGVLTICILEMANGFMVHGVSAAADPRNHNADIGQRYAFENAFKQLWQLEGYALRNRIVRGDFDKSPGVEPEDD